MTSPTTTPATLADLSGTYILDPPHTRIGFVARHAMVTKVRGPFNEFEGSGVVDAADFTKSTVAADDPGRQHRHPQRAARRPPAQQRLPRHGGVPADHLRLHRRPAQTGPTSLELTGDLTIKGVTNPVTIPFEFEGAATDPFGNLRVGFEGSVVINRKDYGVSWNAALETGGVLVSDKVTLEFEVSAIKTA